MPLFSFLNALINIDTFCTIFIKLRKKTLSKKLKYTLHKIFIFIYLIFSFIKNSGCCDSNTGGLSPKESAITNSATPRYYIKVFLINFQYNIVNRE